RLVRMFGIQRWTRLTEHCDSKRTTHSRAKRPELERRPAAARKDASMIPLDAVDWIEIGVAAIASLSALVAIDEIVETVCVRCGWGGYLRALRRPELISVIVPTYNWPEELTAVLRRLRDQEDRNFQVVVAEDGFDHRTRDVISQTHSHGLHVKH